MTLDQFLAQSKDDVRVVVRWAPEWDAFQARLWLNSNCIAWGTSKQLQVAVKDMEADFDIKMIDSEGRLITNHLLIEPSSES